MIKRLKEIKNIINASISAVYAAYRIAGRIRSSDFDYTTSSHLSEKRIKVWTTATPLLGLVLLLFDLLSM